MKMNLMITGAYKYTPEQVEKIEELGLNTDFIQFEKDEISEPEKYDAVICNGLFLHHEIEKFKRLKYIQLTSAGLDRVPVDYIKKNKIELYNARGVYSVPMAEYAVLKILELYKQSRKFYKNQEQHEWIKNRNLIELFGKNAAILGCGSVGIETAKRLKAFGATVIGIDVLECSSMYIDQYGDIKDVFNILPKCDIVVLTLPLTEETHHLVNSEFLQRMKKNSILVNISRGGVVEQAALINALENKKIMGAALDVFNEEPLSENSRLWDMDNVIITPHNSFVGDGNHSRMFYVIYKNLKDWMGKV